MAKVKYGAFITEIKGHVGGTTFQASRGGFTVKNKSSRGTGSRTFGDGHAQLRKNQFSAIAKMWCTLTDAQRLGWNNLLGIWTFLNKFGDVYNGSGYQIFTAANLNRIEIAESTIGDVPTVNNAFDPEISYSDFQIGAATFNRTNANADAIGQTVVIKYSNPVLPSVGVARTKVLYTDVHDITATGTTNLYAGIVAALGYTPPVGYIFYIQRWTCWKAYPKKAYVSTFKIKIVA